MKKLLLLFALCPMCLFAQDVQTTKNAIQFTTGVSVGHRTSDIVTYKPLANFRIGFAYQRHIVKGLSFKVGAQIGTWGYIPNYNTNDAYEVRREYISIEIPSILQYAFSHKKTKPYVEIGVSPMLMGSLTSIFYANEANLFALSTQLGVGVSHEIAPRISVFGQLTGRCIVTPFLRHEYKSPSRGLVYNVGLDVGVGYHF